MIEDRFQVVDHNSLKLPGSCLICGYGGDQRPYIDLGVQVRRYGRLYFCVYCFRECEKVVNGIAGGSTSERTTNLRDGIPGGNEKPTVNKRNPGRPKSTNTRAAKPSAK